MLRSATFSILLAFSCFAIPASAGDICGDTQELADRWQWVANFVEANKHDGFTQAEVSELSEYLEALGEWTVALVLLVDVEGDAEARRLASRLVPTMEAAARAFDDDAAERFVDRIDDAVDIVDALVRRCG